MIDALGGWVRTLCAAALLVSLVLALAPEGKGKAALRFVGGVLLALLLVEPLGQLSPQLLAEVQAKNRLEAAGFSADTADLTEEIYSSFIQKETEEYIWGAARQLGIESLGVRVTVQMGEACPYPWEIALRGSCTQAQQEALSFLLEGELGVPAQRQHWSLSHADQSEEAAEE